MRHAFKAVGAVIAAAALSACSSPAPPVITPPPPAPAPTISLSSKLIEQASAYRAFLDRTAAITPAFSDGDSVARSLQAGESYEPTQLLRGAISYAAIAALQDPAFVAGVKTYARDPDQRRQVAYAIMRDPAYAVGFQGSASAAGLAIQALGTEGQKLYDAGKAVKQSAYDVQKQPWSKADVPNRDQRLTQAKILSATPQTADPALMSRLQAASGGGNSLGLTASPASPPYSPVVVRALAVAALAVLGEASDANLETIWAIMVEPNVGSCVTMSKLNLYQCLAVSRPHYEDIFCLGQHAMMDTGRCLIKASGLPEPYEAKFIPTVDASKGYAPKKLPRKGSARRR